MIPHKIPARIDVPQMPQQPVRIAAEQRLNECGYLIGRYRAPADQADKIIAGLSFADRTLLALEMRERERASYVSDYEPFEGL